jgi:hypothetical protein
VKLNRFHAPMTHLKTLRSDMASNENLCVFTILRGTVERPLLHVST